MDVSAFSEDTFDELEWINKTFRAVEIQDENSTPEAAISSVVAKLQLYVQQVNNALEETSQQVLQNLPRVMHDAEMINKEALLLKEKMREVKEEIVKIEKNTGASMATLEKLDRIKTELQTAKQALHEADNWTVLARDIEDVFESHNIDAIAAKVISMQQSLIVLSNSGDYEDRRLQLEGFKNRLEAILSPSLVKAFTNNNIDESKKFVSIFSGMDRLPQLIKYYSGCQKGLLCQQWRHFIDVDQDHGVQEWLKSFYDVLLSNWQTQVRWCTAVFGDWSMLVGVYIDVLGSLDPSVDSCIESTFKQLSDQLPFLINLKNDLKAFEVNLHAAIIQSGGKEIESWSSLVQALYSPYKNYVSNYGSLEEKHLLLLINNVSTDKREDIMDSIHSLEQTNPRVLSLCREAISRSIQFTESLGFAGLVSALQFCLLKYIEHYFNALRQIEIEKNRNEEWTMFKVCLTLLQSAGELLIETDKLNNEVIQAALNSIKPIKSDQIDMKNVLLTKSALEDYKQLIADLQEGDAGALKKAENKLQKLCGKVFQKSFEVMFGPVAVQLENARVFWNSQPLSPQQQLPDYSFVPLEYITQIGEYLMTLPQHLEPFLLRENPGLSQALIVCSKSGSGHQGETPADVLLGTVAKHTCTAYTDLILALSELSPNSVKQLSIDIGYLDNVLEDLGFGLSENLSQISTLLKLPAETYQSQSAGCSHKLVAAIRQMRNITAT